MANLDQARRLAAKVRFLEDRPSPDCVAFEVEHGFHRDYMLRHGVLVNMAITPDIELWLQEVCDRLYIPRKAVFAFVYSSSEVQADCVNDTLDTCVLRFTSGLVNLMEKAEFQFVAAHELGHFLFMHNSRSNHKGEESPEGYMIRRGRELSSDRIGYLGSGSLDASLRAVMKTASGLSSRHIRFDVARYMQQSLNFAQPSGGESRNSTHPSVLFRSRALLWFATEVTSVSELWQHTEAIRAKIDAKIQKDLETLVDGHVRNNMREIESDLLLWKLCVLIISEGSFTKTDQDKVESALGSEALSGIKSFLQLYPSSELLLEAQKRLNSTVSALCSEFPRSATIIEERAFQRAYDMLELI